MYQVNTTIDTADNDSTLGERDRNCKAIDKNTGELCGETESLGILQEFQRLYEARIENVDREFDGEFERVSMKLQIMREWIKDLGEQNVMLVHTVEDLEQAACSRVKLLEDKLRQSSMLVSENISKSDHTEEAITILSHRISELEKDEEYLQQKIEFLQSDIRGLLELIRRARQNNSWNTDGITFFEIQPNDIPVPLDCTCGQEETNSEKMQSLKLQVEQLQENERKMIAYQAELEEKVADLTTKLFTKENSLKKYISQIQGFGDNLKRRPELAGQVVCNSSIGNDDEAPDIVLMADIVESILIEKDLETKELKERLLDAESKLATAYNQKSMDICDLKLQLEKKCAELNEIHGQMANLQKESLETREVLTTEVAEKHDAIMGLRKEVTALEDQCRNANMQIQFKEDIIKEMRKELKQATLKETYTSQTVCVDPKTLQEDDKALNNPRSQQDKIVSNLINIKSLMEREKDALSNIKMNLEKLLEESRFNNKEEYHYDIASIYEKLRDMELLLKNYKPLTDYPESTCDLKNCMANVEMQLVSLQNSIENNYTICDTNKNELDAKAVLRKIVANIEIIEKLYSEKEKAIETINLMIKMENITCLCNETPYIASSVDNDSQYKMMESFKDCTSEVLATMDDIREEIGVAVFTFNSQYQKLSHLSKMVGNVQDQLTTTRERIIETINRLQLQEDERIRHNERITTGKFKLKDIKNEINHAQSRLSSRISEIQENAQEQAMLSYTEVCICNDLLSLVLEELDQILSNLTFQAQGCCITSTLGELKNHLYDVDTAIKCLQKKTEETILESDIAETAFCEKERKFENLEADVDCIRARMQNVLEVFLSSLTQVPDDSNVMDRQTYNQTVNEVQRARQDLHRLKKEYDGIKQKTLQRTSSVECDEKLCQWRCRVIDLQDQVRVLKHEVKCKQEANNYLKSNIEAIEEELRSVQAKAENYRRTHSVDSMELKKKIIELENTIKTQKETESTLRQHLNDSEIELKRSKDLLNSFSEHGVEGMLLRYGCNQFKHEAMNMPQLFKTLQSAMQSMKCGVHDLEHELKKLVCEDSPHACSSTRSVMTLINKLEKYETELDGCSEEIEKLKNALYSKDKLLENMDEIIRIQKDSIVMTQAELKELHQKLQEKIDTQNRVISQYEKEKSELLKQNELQIQTIGHLQNAVVEAKKCLDQMGHKTTSDLQEKSETIRVLTIYVEETQSQYNECFTEAAKQDKLMELQRDAINDLQEKIRRMEHDKRVTVNLLQLMYYSILNSVQEQLEARMKEFHAVKSKIDVLIRSNSCWENKYLCVKKSWQESEEKLQELRKTAIKNEREKATSEDKMCQCEVEVADKNCFVQDLHSFDTQQYKCPREYELQSENEILVRENEDMKRQLLKWKLDIDIIDKELKLERQNDSHAQQITAQLQKMRNTECCLRSENERLKFDLENRTKEIEDLLQKLHVFKERSLKFEKLLKKSEDKQIEVDNLHKEIAYKETIIEEQIESIEELRKKLDTHREQNNEYASELNSAEEMLSVMRDRIESLKILLKEKSDNMAKLQADYEVLKNEHSILRTESNIVENKAKEDISHLRKKLKEVQLQLCVTEDNYHRVTQDFNKTQEKMVQAARREVDLQESLTNIEKDYSSKLICAEKEEGRLVDLVDKLTEELEDVRRNYLSKSSEVGKLQELCNSYAERINDMQKYIEKEKEKMTKIEESNRCLIQQLQECVEQNCSLVQEKTFIEENNCKVVTELQEMHRSLLELKKECQLKNKSLACMSAELTQTAMSRSELCNESQYVVSCIRVWMEEQKKHVETLVSKLKFKQQQLVQLGFEKKALLVNIKELRRVNNLLTQRLKRTCRAGRGVKSMCAGCYVIPSSSQHLGARVPLISNYQRSYKKCSIGPIKTARRTSVYGNPWWFPKMEYLTNELRKNNMWYNENFYNRMNGEGALEESRDCGYQSSTSK